MPVESNRRVAIFGTFDVENYGDLLFPLIAQARLADLGTEVIAVSPAGGGTRYRDAFTAVSQEAFVADVQSFDGILIGGGNIVHLRDFGLPAYGSMAYPALWAGSTAHAARHGLPIAWNAPGVLAPRNHDTTPDWLQRVVAAADRFAVRDEASAEAMARWSGRRPDVMPDTALDLPRVWPAPMLADRYDEIRKTLGMPETGPIIALHAKDRSLGDMSVDIFAAKLDAALEASNATAILLAIGRCHGDHHLVQALHAAIPARTRAFDEADKLQDIAAIIANADAYLGASLHGHITAAAYGVPARLVAVPDLHKFAGQAGQMGRSGDIAASWDTALRDLPMTLAQPHSTLPESVAVQLDGHWRAIAEIVTAGSDVTKPNEIFGEADVDAAVAKAVQAIHEGADRSVGAAASRLMESQPATDEDAAAEWDGDVVNQMILSKDFNRVSTRIATQLARAPKHLPAQLSQVRLAVAKGEHAHSIALSEALAKDRPENPWVWLSHLQSLAHAGQNDAALKHFTEGLDRPEINDTVVAAAINDMLMSTQLRYQVSSLKAALERDPENRSLQLRLAMRAHANRQYGLAQEMFAKAEKAGPLPAYAARARSQLLPHEGSMDAAVAHLKAEVASGADDVEKLCRLCRFAAAAGQFDLSASALHRALDLYPLEWRVIFRINRVFLGQSENDAIFARLKTVAETAAPGPSWLLQYALFALKTGNENEGRQTLTQLADAEVVGPTALSLLAALNAVGTAKPRAPVLEDTHVRVVPKAGAKGTVLLFGGLLGGLSQIDDRHIDKLLADLPANVIYLRDPFGRIYLNGIPELGADEAAMHDALSRKIAELGDGQVIAIGGSGAGYAALRAGLAIGADTVISLAGFVAPGMIGDEDPSHGQRGLDEMFGSDLDAYDLRPTLASQQRLRLIHVAGGSYAPDLARARDLEGLANTDVLIMEGVDTHHVSLPAIANGTLKRILEENLTRDG